MNCSRLPWQRTAVVVVVLAACCSCRGASVPGTPAADSAPVSPALPTVPTLHTVSPAKEIPWPPVGKKAPDCTLHASNEVRAPDTRSRAVVGLAFSPDGEILASVTGITTYLVSVEVMLGSEADPPQVVVSDAETGRQLSAFADESRLALHATFSSGGRLLAFGAADGAVHLWDVAAGKLLRTLRGHHRGPVYSTAFSPDGKTLASGSADGTAVLWDVASGRARRTLEGHDSWVTSVVFSPDGKALAAGTSEQAVVLWDAASGERLRALEAAAKHVSHVAFSPDGRLLAAASPGGSVVLWDPSTGAPQVKLYTRVSAGAIAFSPDGSLLAVSRPGRVLLWSVQAERQVHELVGHDRTQYASIAFAPDGRTVAAGAPDGSVTLWQMAPSREYCQVRLVSSRLAGAPSVAPRPSPSPIPPARPSPLPTLASIGEAPDLSGLGTMVFGTYSDTHTIRLLFGEREPVALTEGKGARLSPDGCTLLVSRARKRPPYGTEYLLMDVNTANPRAARLDHKPWGSSTVAGMTWNPDSTSLTFTTSGSAAKTSWSGSLYRIDAADGRITRITARGGGRPLYSPDGRWIATTTPEIGYSHGSIGLWGAEGQGGRKLFDKVWPGSIRWAADSSGFFVAFTWLLGGEGSELFWVPIAGETGAGDPVQLGHLPVDNVAWLPGGRQYTYYTDRLRRANWDGSEDVELPEPKQEGAAALRGISGLGARSWSPDGRWRFTRGGLLDVERLDVFVPLTLERFHGWLDDTHYLAGAALTEGTELYYCEIPENCRLILQMDDTLSWASYAGQRCSDERGEIPEVPYPPTREADVVAYHRETMLMQGLDFGARLNAAWALAQMGPVEGAIPALVEAMQEDPAMRWVSARSLATYGPDAMEAVPALIEAMEEGCGADREHYCPLESEKLVEALQSITGQEYGPDAAAWRAWWVEQ